MTRRGGRAPHGTLSLFDRDEKKTLVIVPTERHAERLGRTGVASQTRAAFRSQLLDALCPHVAFAEPAESRMVLALALGRIAQGEPRLGPILRAGGAPWAKTCAALDGALGALFAAGTPARALERVGRGRGVHAWKARVLACAMDAVDEELARVGRVDARRAAARLGEAVAAAAPEAVEGAAGATAVEARWILVWDPADLAWWRALDAKLSRRGGGARISLPATERGLDAARERDAFEVLADEVARHLEEPPHLEPLAHVWGEPRFGVSPSADLLARVRLCAASDAVAQAEAAADEVARALRRGVAPEQIAVVPCSPTDEVVRPIARALSSAHVAVEGRLSHGPDDGILGAVWRLLEEQPADVEHTRPDHVRRTRELFADAAMTPGSGDAARRALAQDLPPAGIAAADLEASCRDARAWEVLDAALERYEALARVHAADDLVPTSVFATELRAAVGETLRGPSGTRIGAVRVPRAGEVAMQDLEVLVVVEVNQGAAPWTPRAARVLSDALLAEIAQAAPRATPCASFVHRARELGALSLALASSERVVLVHRERDVDGSHLAPAPLVTWLVRGGASVVRRTSAPEPAAPGPGTRDRARVERARESFFFDPSRAADESIGDVQAGEGVRGVLVQETGGGARALSVTALEKMSTCAFRGFAEHVLGARAREAAPDLPDAREEGTLAHEALAAAFTATGRAWGERPRDAEAIRAEALAAARRLLEERGAESALRRLTLERTLGVVAAVVDEALADEAWDFALAEQPFGSARKGSWPELVVSASLRLRGQIDRVDARHATGARGEPPAWRVLDYKRRANVAREASARLGTTALQLPIYAVAVRQALGGDVDGGYLPFLPRDLANYRPPTKHAGRMRELVAGAAPPVFGVALEVVDKIRRGALAPRPREERACARCELDGGCRKPRFAIEPDE